MPRHAGDREAVARPAARRVVVAAVELRVAHDRLARDLGERDVLRREPRARAREHRGAELAGRVERPLQRLHAAERAADRAAQPLDAEVPAERPVHRHEILHRDRREAQPVRACRSRGRASSGPVVPLQPPSRFDEITKQRSVSIGLPGPIIVSHQPGRVPGPDACRVRVAGQRVADVDGVRALGVERAVRLVGDLDRRERRARCEHQRVRARRRA